MLAPLSSPSHGMWTPTQACSPGRRWSWPCTAASCTCKQQCRMQDADRVWASAARLELLVAIMIPCVHMHGGGHAVACALRVCRYQSNTHITRSHSSTKVCACVWHDCLLPAPPLIVCCFWCLQVFASLPRRLRSAGLETAPPCCGTRSTPLQLSFRLPYTIPRTSQNVQQ